MIVSSGLARNYDAADLVREPWHLLLPYIASTGTATLLFLLWKVIRAFRKAPLPWRMFPPFLGLYWLTAPVAWLYGVPYEEFQSPADAVGSNALTLLIVAGWRVSIITSVVSLGLGTPRLQTFLIDLAYGWTLIVIASYLDPRPILLDMGGIRADPSMVAWGNDVQFPPLEASNVTLAEQLGMAGYATSAFHNTSYFSHTAGFHQGFTQVAEEYGFKSEVAPTIGRIQAFLRDHEGDPAPFFLWSHLMVNTLYLFKTWPPQPD